MGQFVKWLWDIYVNYVWGSITGALISFMVSLIVFYLMQQALAPVETIETFRKIPGIVGYPLEVISFLAMVITGTTLFTKALISLIEEIVDSLR